jgi:hypothetical protein
MPVATPLFPRWFPLLWLGLAALWSGTGQALLAQKPARAAAVPRFEARVEPEKIGMGSPFELIFTLTDGQGKSLRAPSLADFRVISGPSVELSTVFQQGKMSSRESWVYVLEPKKPGIFSIGPASVLVDGELMRTQPLQIRVAEASRSNVPPGADAEVFVVGEVSDSRVVIGQQLTFRIKLYTQVSVENADWLEMPKFEGFYSLEKRRFDTRTRQETLNGRQYAVRVLQEMALFPQETGPLEIGPVRVRVGLVRPGPMGPFFGPVQVNLGTEPVRLQVDTLPGPAPANFSGGVGRYEWTVRADRDTVTTDDALTLRVALRGNGDPQRFVLPRLDLPEGLETFDPKILEEETYENGEEFVHTKVAEYVILPKDTGQFVFTPELVFFNPDSNRFLVQRPDTPLQVRVLAGQNYAIELPAPDTSGADPLRPPWERLWERLRLGDSLPWYWALLALPVLLVLFLLGRRSTRSVTEPKPPPRPVDNARLARERLSLLRSSAAGNPGREFYDALFHELQTYLSARLDIPPGQLTKAVVQAYLADRRTPEHVIASLLSAWRTCELVVFASLPPTVPAETTWREADTAIQELERR